MINRRNFLKAGFLSSSILIMSGSKLFGITTTLQTINVLQNDLFPKANKLRVDVLKYFKIILSHSHIDNSEKKFIKNGVKWLNEEALDIYDNIYIKLSPTKRQKVLKQISKTSWGESWLKTVLGYILEAIYSDPIYTVSNGSGWDWCKFKTGLPQPKKAFL